MKQGYTHLVFLIDRSGSMKSKWSDTINGIYDFFQNQKKEPGELTCSLYTFNSSLVCELDFVNVQSIKELSVAFPEDKMTALYDSFCQVVDQVGLKLSNMNEFDRPEKILFVTLTDGEENQSRKFKLEDVRSRIATQRDVYSWNFTFLGVDFDAVSMAKDFGVNPDFCMNFDSQDTKISVHRLSAATSNYRNSQSRTLDSSYSQALHNQ